MPSSTKIHWFFTGLIALWSLVYLFVGETIPAGNGCGWDGQTYCRLAQDFFNQIFVIKQGTYTTSRALPSGLVYLALKLFHITPDLPAVIAGFRIINMLCLCGATYLFGRILLLFQLRFEHQFLAFVGLLFSFALLKSHYYNPVITDTVGFFLGMVVAYCYLARKQWLLLTTLVSSFFVWPNMIYGGLVLFAFPAKKNAQTKILQQVEDTYFPRIRQNSKFKIQNSIFNIRLDIFLAGSIVLIVGVNVLYYYYVQNAPTDGIYDSVKVIREIFWLSLLASLAYLYYSCKNILDFRMSLKNIYEEIASVKTRIFISVIIFIALQQLISFISNTAIKNPWTISSFFSFVNLLATSRPFINLISHVVYFGPIVILAAMAWRSIGAVIRPFGLGLAGFFCFHLLLGNSSESRFVINFLPFLTLFTVLAIRDIPIRKHALVGFTLIAFCLSKVWWIFRIPASADTSKILEFPYQKLFMNYGPWINHDMYMIHGLVIAACTVYLFNVFQFSRLRQGQG